MIKIIAVTGGIGSGKSTVSNLLRNLGYCVYDADVFARQVLFYPEVQLKIENLFGAHVFVNEGILDRNLVRQMIYENPLLKKQLEDILHPAIADELKKKTQNLKDISLTQWVFYEASLIFENGKQKNFDACILVKTDKVTKLDRIKQSRSLKEDDIQKIIDTQMPDDEKAKLADYIIENSSHRKDLENSVFNLIRFLYQKFSPSSF